MMMKRYYMVLILGVLFVGVYNAYALMPPTNLHIAFPLPTWSSAPIKIEEGIREITASESNSEIILDVGNGVKLFFKKDGYYKVKVNESFLHSSGELSSLPIVNCVKNSFRALQSFKINNANISSFVSGVDSTEYGFSYHFLKREVNGSESTLHFLSGNGNVELVVKIVPATFNISGQNWYGYGISYEVLKCDRQIVSLDCSNVWNLGGRINDHYTWFHSPYSRKRGFGKYFIESNAVLTGSKYGNMFFAGQPFNVVVGDNYSLLSFFADPSIVANSITSTSSNFIINYDYKLGIIKSSIEVPVNYNLFLNKKLDNQDYVKLSYYINGWIRDRKGMSPLKRSPIAGASKSSQIKYVSHWDDYAKKIMPKVKELNFKRVLVGPGPSKQQLNFEYIDKNKAMSDIKSFCDIAHGSGIETIMWFETCTSNKNSKLVAAHPEWVVMQPGNIVPHYSGINDLLLISPNDDYLSWMLSDLREIRLKTGLDGVWLDSFELASRLLQYTENEPRYHFDRLIELVKDINSLGMHVYAEAMSPYVHSSFWVRKDRYASYKNVEYGIVGTSPYTNRPDSDFINYFLAASYKSFPIIDIHPYIDDVQLYDNQEKFFSLIKKTNYAVNFVDEKLGMESQLQTFENGTLWVSDFGYAVFLHNDLDKLVLPRDNTLSIKIFPCADVSTPIVKTISPDNVEITGLKKYTVIVLYRN